MPAKRQLLVCSAEFPEPPLNGTLLILHELLVRLRERFRITLLSYAREDQLDARFEGVETVTLARPSHGGTAANATAWVTGLLSRRAFGFAGYPGPMEDVVAQLVSTGDWFAAHVVHTELAELGRVLKAHGVPSVLSAIDARYLNIAATADMRAFPANLAWRDECRRVRRFERREYREFTRVTVVTDHDRQALHRLEPALPIDVITNGVDPRMLAPDERPRDPNDVLFLGTMDWPPNVAAVEWFADEVWPAIHAAHPQATFSVVGRNLAEHERSRLDGRPGVRAVGEVPQVDPWLRAAGVVVVPMVSGTGIKNKLLEALATGAPTVSTSLAVEGTAVADGVHTLIADGADEFGAGVRALMADPARAAELGNAGRDLVGRSHSWAAVAQAYAQLYQDCAKELDNAREKSRGTSQ